MDIKQVSENTFYFDFGWVTVPFYKTGEKELILVDTGLKTEGQAICDYLLENGWNPKAIIFTHIHIDHVNGSLPILEKYDIPTYGSYLDMNDSYRVHGIDENLNSFRITAYQHLYEFLSGHGKSMKNIDSIENLDVEGHIFKIIDAPGHTVCHKLVVTPDGVCCVGDLYMTGHTLETAKFPYSRVPDTDIHSKEKCKELPYKLYISSHDGAFSKAELAGIADENIAIYKHIIEEISKIYQVNPGTSEDDMAKKLSDVLSVKIYAHDHTMQTLRKLCVLAGGKSL